DSGATPDRVAFDGWPEHTLLNVRPCVSADVWGRGQPSGDSLIRRRLPVWKRPKIPIVLPVKMTGQCQLFHVVDTGNLARLVFGLGEGRQEQAGQNGDDGDHDE